jgi:hypothetical protein
MTRYMGSTNNTKALPGSEETVNYPGPYHYFARAIIESADRSIPLVNDQPGLRLPGIGDSVPLNDAEVLAAKLAMECTRIALPPMPLLRIEDLMEFRENHKELLRGFRRSMLRYAADLNDKIKDLTVKDFESAMEFFVKTEIAPAMDELNMAYE